MLDCMKKWTFRDAKRTDIGEIVRLNSAWQHFTSPLDEDLLGHLAGQAAYHRVLELDGRLVAFLLAFCPGAGYDSPNYRWFCQAGGDFLYIDRIVIAREHQRRGIGDAFYDDIADFAVNHGIPRLVCEVDIEPLNESSLVFHERRGFVEVGTQWLEGRTKRVSLRECPVPGVGDD